MIAEVIVDLPVWRLDHPLSYRVPERFWSKAQVGKIVRIPLRGRRSRGWIVGITAESEDGLQEIAAFSGPGPVFDSVLLEVYRRLSRIYLHPLAEFLKLATPARVGRGIRSFQPTESPSNPSEGTPTLLRLGPAENAADRYAAIIEEGLETERATIVVVPEVGEGSRVLDNLAKRFASEAAIVHSAVDPAARSESIWRVAAGKARVILGGRAAVFAPPVPLHAIIVHSEHDRSLKEQRSPYYDGRTVAEVRCATGGARAMFASPTPSLTSYFKAQHEGWTIEEPSRDRERSMWPPVELVEPERAALPRRAIALVVQAQREGTRVLVLLTRKGPGSSGLEEVASYLRKVTPGATISVISKDTEVEGAADRGLARKLDSDVVVATSAALADVSKPKFKTGVLLGVDTFLTRPTGRAVEDTFEVMWSAASVVAESAGRSGRVLVETKAPNHHAIQALVRCDYRFFYQRELKEREAAEVPPFRRLIRLRSKVIGDQVQGRLGSLPGVDLLGPVPSDGGEEALLKVADFDLIADQLRDTVSTSETALGVEVDPRDW